MSDETLSAEELGNKLLQSVKEMKAGKTARVSRVEPNEVAEARGKTGLTQVEFAEAGASAQQASERRTMRIAKLHLHKQQLR